MGGGGGGGGGGSSHFERGWGLSPLIFQVYILFIIWIIQ